MLVLHAFVCVHACVVWASVICVCVCVCVCVCACVCICLHTLVSGQMLSLQLR